MLNNIFFNRHCRSSKFNYNHNNLKIMHCNLLEFCCLIFFYSKMLFINDIYLYIIIIL